MRGTFYGIGVGPGDPEYLTIKAIKTIGKCTVVAYPKAMGDAESIAYQIAKPYISPEAQRLPVTFFMEREMGKRVEKRQIAADKIAAVLEQGKDVAFLTLGDPTLYSTCMYLSAILEGRGFQCEIIPGVPAICAMAAKLKKPLAEGDESLVILPVSKDAENLQEALALADNIALMKVSKTRGCIQKVLEGQEEQTDVFGVSDCGMAGEKVYQSLEALMTQEKPSYFTSLLIKNKKG